jgi:redox-sensitive bicupin YhaK (pirin superfamily)
MSDKILNIETLHFPWRTQDPFIFCAYHRDEYPEGDENMGVKEEYKNGRQIGSDFTIKDGWRMYHGQTTPGFPYHPHRGFETITINKEGVVDHSDSLGAAGRFMEGDVQWMTAGKGILHSEMFPLLHQAKENTLEIFQIWLNLPSHNKMVDPHFKMLWKENVPVLKIKDEKNKKTSIDIIAGKLNDLKAVPPTPNSWAADPQNAVGIYTVKMDAGATWTLPATIKAAVRDLYFYHGDSIIVEGHEINQHVRITAQSDADIIIKNGSNSGSLLILEGVPIKEPVAQHGPFVMNTQQEIKEAFEEYRKTEFGGWPWGVTEKVHDRDKGRFALHGDGREELPE